jgi:hypothetical protein
LKAHSDSEGTASKALCSTGTEGIRNMSLGYAQWQKATGSRGRTVLHGVGIYTTFRVLIKD